MELDSGLKHGFDLADLKVKPLQRTIITPQGTRNVSELAIAFLMQLAGSPRQVIVGTTLREQLGVESADLHNCFVELQLALGDSADAPQYIMQLGTDSYELIAPVSIHVPPVPTTEQILNLGDERAP